MKIKSPVEAKIGRVTDLWEEPECSGDSMPKNVRLKHATLDETDRLMNKNIIQPKRSGDSLSARTARRVERSDSNADAMGRAGTTQRSLRAGLKNRRPFGALLQVVNLTCMPSTGEMRYCAGVITPRIVQLIENVFDGRADFTGFSWITHNY